MNNLTVFNSELIPVYTTDKGEQVVLGRELHAALKVKTPYDKWFPRMVEYGQDKGFLEGKDFSTFLSKSTGGRPSQNHVISLRMAKHIATIQKSDIGFEIREKLFEIQEMVAEKRQIPSYQIDDEIERAEAWLREARERRALEEKNKVLQIDNAALEQENKDLDLENLYLEGRVDYLQPKADGYDEFIELGECLGVRDTANLLGVGQNEFIDWLRDRGYIHKKTLRAKAQYLDKAGNANQWFDEKVVPCNDGIPRRQLFVTSKGQDAFRKMLKGVDLSQYKRKRK